MIRGISERSDLEYKLGLEEGLEIKSASSQANVAGSEEI